MFPSPPGGSAPRAGASEFGRFHEVQIDQGLRYLLREFTPLPVFSQQRFRVPVEEVAEPGQDLSLVICEEGLGVVEVRNPVEPGPAVHGWGTHGTLRCRRSHLKQPNRAVAPRCP